MYLRRRTFLTTALGCAAGARLCAGASRVSLRVAVGQYLAMCPFYMGYEAGYFKDAGFDIEIESGSGSVQMIPLAAGGKLDVCFLAASPPLLNAVSRGARLRIVAAREAAFPACNRIGTVYGRRRDFPNGLHDLHQLKGKTVAVQGTAGSVVEFAFELMLKKHGMTVDEVQVRILTAPESVAALRAGGVDAVVSGGSDLFHMLESMQLSAGPCFADTHAGFQYSYIIFGRAMLEGDVVTAARFLQAYFAGARDFVKGKTPAFMDEYAKSNNLDPKIVRGECRDTFVHDGHINPSDLDSFALWATNRRYCPTRIDSAGMIDPRFLAATPKVTW